MEWLFFIILSVNGNLNAVYFGPFPNQYTCEQNRIARVVNTPPSYAVLATTECVQRPKPI